MDKILNEEAEWIKLRQLQVVDEYGLMDHTGKLRKGLQGHFNIQDFDGGPRLTLRYVKYARFLDMPWITSLRREGLHLYNRVVFGRIYNNTDQRVREAYKKELQEKIDEMKNDVNEQINTDE